MITTENVNTPSGFMFKDLFQNIVLVNFKAVNLAIYNFLKTWEEKHNYYKLKSK